MSAGDACDDVRGLIAELALGIASGEERTRALKHSARCPRCRRELGEFAEVADEMLLLAPVHEPPPGFEAELLERLVGSASRPHRLMRWLGTGWHRALTPAAAALAAAVLAVVVVLEITQDDRETAAVYRRALQQANGSYFGALPLRDRSGRRAGLVFGYEGRPSWVFVLVQEAAGSGRWKLELETRSGDLVTLGSVEVRRGQGSFGRALPVPLKQVKRVSVGPRAGEARLTAVARPQK
jgi:hypothetical protein